MNVWKWIVTIILVLMLIGIAVGYPDDANPVNQHATERALLEDLVNWYGLE